MIDSGVLELRIASKGQWIVEISVVPLKFPGGLLWDELHPLKKDMLEFLTPSTSECDLLEIRSLQK